MMDDDLAHRMLLEADYARLQRQYDRLNATLDDGCFQQTASHLLGYIHTTLCAGGLPSDLIDAYQQLDCLIRVQIAQRQLMPNRPLF